jgi:hypothetical protein
MTSPWEWLCVCVFMQACWQHADSAWPEEPTESCEHHDEAEEAMQVTVPLVLFSFSVVSVHSWREHSELHSYR